MKISIAIATNSVDKINGIKLAFSRYFRVKETEIAIVHRAAKSAVPEQPFNEEIYQGVRNRVDTLIPINTFDYYVSCEAGIEKVLNLYFNVQVVCIYDKKNYFFGKSAGWQIPSKDIETIRKTNLDKYLRDKGYNCLEDVLGKGFSRQNAVMQATEHALRTMNLL